MKTSDERPTKKRRTIPDNDFACEHSQGATYRCNYCHGFACVNCIAGIGDRDDLFNEHAPRDIDLEFHERSHNSICKRCNDKWCKEGTNFGARHELVLPDHDTATRRICDACHSREVRDDKKCLECEKRMCKPCRKFENDIDYICKPCKKKIQGQGDNDKLIRLKNRLIKCGVCKADWDWRGKNCLGHGCGAWVCDKCWKTVPEDECAVCRNMKFGKCQHCNRFSETNGTEVMNMCQRCHSYVCHFCDFSELLSACAHCLDWDDKYPCQCDVNCDRKTATGKCEHCKAICTTIVDASKNEDRLCFQCHRVFCEGCMPTGENAVCRDCMANPTVPPRTCSECEKQTSRNELVRCYDCQRFFCKKCIDDKCYCGKYRCDDCKQDGCRWCKKYNLGMCENCDEEYARIDGRLCLRFCEKCGKWVCGDCWIDELGICQSCCDDRQLEKCEGCGEWAKEYDMHLCDECSESRCESCCTENLPGYIGEMYMCNKCVAKGCQRLCGLCKKFECTAIALQCSGCCVRICSSCEASCTCKECGKKQCAKCVRDHGCRGCERKKKQLEKDRIKKERLEKEERQREAQRPRLICDKCEFRTNRPMHVRCLKCNESTVLCNCSRVTTASDVQYFMCRTCANNGGAVHDPEPPKPCTKCNCPQYIDSAGKAACHNCMDKPRVLTKMCPECGKYSKCKFNIGCDECKRCVCKMCIGECFDCGSQRCASCRRANSACQCCEKRRSTDSRKRKRELVSDCIKDDDDNDDPRRCQACFIYFYKSIETKCADCGLRLCIKCYRYCECRKTHWCRLCYRKQERTKCRCECPKNCHNRDVSGCVICHKKGCTRCNDCGGEVCPLHHDTCFCGRTRCHQCKDDDYCEICPVLGTGVCEACKINAVYMGDTTKLHHCSEDYLICDDCRVSNYKEY